MPPLKTGKVPAWRRSPGQNAVRRRPVAGGSAPCCLRCRKGAVTVNVLPWAAKRHDTTGVGYHDQTNWGNVALIRWVHDW